MQIPATGNRATTGTNLEHARLHNRRVVLEAIRQARQLTRAELSRLTSLTAQTISNIVAELVDEQMLLMHAPEKIPRGQPPIPLSLNPDGGFAIGLHVNQHHAIGILMDLTGAMRARRSFDVSYPSFDEALPLLAKSVSTLRRKIAGKRLLGVGLGLPGPFGVAGMRAVGPTGMPGWDDPTNMTRLEAKIGLPVYMENDATAAAIGERLYGVAGGLRDFAYLFVGHGLGAGLYLDNRLYAGHWHNAGEIGHVIMTPNGKPCYCGNHGCLERYFSGASLVEHLGVGVNRDLDTLDLTERKYAAGIRSWLAEAVPALRHAISMLECLFDPETVLVGGTLPDTILRPLVEQASPLTRSVSARTVRLHERVQLANAGPNCVALGAAALMVLAELSPDYEALLKA